MKHATPWILCGLLVLGGCASHPQTVTRPQLQAIIDDDAKLSGSWVSYAGTKDGYQYVVHGLGSGSRTYRVPTAELPMENPFPYSTDSSAWRPLRWDLQPMHDAGVSAIITNLFRANGK